LFSAWGSWGDWLAEPRARSRHASESTANATMYRLAALQL
jgi:hypothetical protein